MRRLIAVTTVLAALGIGAASAQAASDPYAQASRLCQRQNGGLSYSVIEGWYYCQGFGAALTDRQVSQADRLCSRNEGTFYLASPNSYGCDFTIN